ncbi:MAG: hypothetical protein A2Y74_01490 [Actinobacteria bacterium RBG_13_63_9]|nr:MAG: hypothetical protein A2Y74_01490 [Actinobacteria bacterium RBG_13_63_9]
MTKPPTARELLDDLETDFVSLTTKDLVGRVKKVQSYCEAGYFTDEEAVVARQVLRLLNREDA